MIQGTTSTVLLYGAKNKYSSKSLREPSCHTDAWELNTQISTMTMAMKTIAMTMDPTGINTAATAAAEEAGLTTDTTIMAAGAEEAAEVDEEADEDTEEAAEVVEAAGTTAKMMMMDLVYHHISTT